ncbi:DUF6053 domain-containing protein [Lysobacter enzymogenes]|uniref:DUF6053 domain-containing protein n=1 Tax=Lysobacter enzymogenes TaxID=69 RepID=UPI003D18E930
MGGASAPTPFDPVAAHGYKSVGVEAPPTKASGRSLSHERIAAGAGASKNLRPSPPRGFQASVSPASRSSAAALPGTGRRPASRSRPRWPGAMTMPEQTRKNRSSASDTTLITQKRPGSWWLIA